jgi:hypothetical protein
MFLGKSALAIRYTMSQYYPDFDPTIEVGVFFPPNATQKQSDACLLIR